ncbi:MAG: hypothetical protein KC933_12875, partial [Myxococcales bacterium]|nr:hypothetical protein [Myxococcales bacterium]
MPPAGHDADDLDPARTLCAPDALAARLGPAWPHLVRLLGPVEEAHTLEGVCAAALAAILPDGLERPRSRQALLRAAGPERGLVTLLLDALAPRERALLFDGALPPRALAAAYARRAAHRAASGVDHAALEA